MKKLNTVIILLFLFFPVFGAGKRVVSFAPALTELIFQLGRGKYLVGRSSACDYPAEAAKLPVAGDFGNPEVERTLKLKPDLVVGNDFARPEQVRIFRRAGIQVERRQCGTLAEYMKWIDRLGELLECRSEAAAEKARLTVRLNAALARAQKRQRKPTVCWVIWDSPLLIAGADSLPDTVIHYAGGVNIARNVHPEYVKASRDWLLNHQPDVIVWTCTRKLDKRRRFWGALRAVKNGRIIELPDCSLVLRPGPRLPDGIDLVQKKLEALP